MENGFAYFALCVGAFSLVLGAICLYYTLLRDGESIYPEAEDYDDQERREEIPLYPDSPRRVTGWGIHQDHVRRGFQTESGCPVCFEFRLHVN